MAILKTRDFGTFYVSEIAARNMFQDMMHNFFRLRVHMASQIALSLKRSVGSPNGLKPQLSISCHVPCTADVALHLFNHRSLAHIPFSKLTKASGGLVDTFFDGHSIFSANPGLVGLCKNVW